MDYLNLPEKKTIPPSSMDYSQFPQSIPKLKIESSKKKIPSSVMNLSKIPKKKKKEEKQ